MRIQLGKLATYLVAAGLFASGLTAPVTDE